MSAAVSPHTTTRCIARAPLARAAVSTRSGKGRPRRTSDAVTHAVDKVNPPELPENHVDHLPVQSGRQVDGHARGSQEVEGGLGAGDRLDPTGGDEFAKGAVEGFQCLVDRPRNELFEEGSFGPTAQSDESPLIQAQSGVITLIV